jgi:Type II secretion system (T2SS), protein E, N-terminal domain
VIGDFLPPAELYAPTFRVLQSGGKMKLAKILVERGFLQPALLQSMSGYQNMEDEQLGACLVEDGLLSTDQLAQALSVIAGVPPALDADFERADPALRKKLRSHQAANFKSIPLYSTPSRRIAVAMVNPAHPKIIDELSFVLGATVEPMVTSEVALAHHLEVLYAMPKRRTTGFHPVAGVMRESANSTPPPALTTSQHRLELVPLAVDDEEQFESQPTPARGHVKLPSKSRRPTQSYLAAVDELPQFVPSEPDAPKSPAGEAISQTPIPPMVAVTGADSAVEQILASPDRQAAADNLFEFMRSCFGAGAMFIVGQVFAEGRFGYNEGVPRPAVDALVFSLSLPSCFHEAHGRAKIFHGAPSPSGDPVHRPLWEALGCQRPPEVLVAPVVTAGQVPILLYAQGHNNGRIDRFAVRRMEHVCSALANTLLRLAS